MKNITLGLFSLLFIFTASAQKSSQVNSDNSKENTESKMYSKTKHVSELQYSKVKDIVVEPTNALSKFYSSVNIGFMPANQVSRSFHVINGYKFKPNWQAGIGMGVEDIGGYGYIPLFLHGQYNLLTTKTTPFLAVIVGYEMALNNQNQNKGGFTTGAQLGLNHYFSDHVGLTTSVGYRYGYFKQNNNFGWWGGEPTVTIREINRFEFRFGLVFK